MNGRWALAEEAWPFPLGRRAQVEVHSWKLTWKPKRGPIKTTVPLKWGYMGFHVCLGECTIIDYQLSLAANNP